MNSGIPRTRDDDAVRRLRDVPILEDKLVLLRPVKQTDAEDMFEYGSDEEVVRFLPWGPYKSVDEVCVGIEKFFLTRPENGLPAAYAVVWKATGNMIGTCDFHSVNPVENSGGIGFVLNRDYWNRGIITRAAELLIGMGRSYLGFTEVTLAHLPENSAAARVAEKLGFRETGRQKYRFMAGQEPKMMVHYRLELE